MERQFSIEQPSRNVSRVTFDLPTARSGWEAWCLLRSDVHHDNPKTDWNRERRLLDEAVQRGAPVLDCGDTFCAMQGKYDRRSSLDAIRDEHRIGGDYLGALVREAKEFYSPYAHHFIRFAHGNHETSQIDRHGTDLCANLAAALNVEHGTQIGHGGYSGWVRFRFRGEHNPRRHSKVLWYHHGYGGGGPVTGDMIQSNRQLTYVRGADIMATGHTHDSWQRTFATRKLTQQDKVESGEVLYCKIGTGKDAYADGNSGYEVEKGHAPKPLGMQWLRFTYDVSQNRVRVEAHRAWW